MTLETIVNEYILEICDKKEEYIVQKCLEDLKKNEQKYGKLLDYNTLTRERLREIIKHGLMFEEMMKSE
jgi:hypothetical protein